MDTILVRRLQNLIKLELKNQEISYLDLASVLGVSEVTVKRLLTGDDLSLQKLHQLNEVLEINLFDALARLANEPERIQYFTDAQDEAFAKHPELLLYFQALVLLNLSPAEIQSANALSDVSTHCYLRYLENLGLIRLEPKNRVVILVEPAYGFDANSKVVKQQIKSSLEYCFDTVLRPDAGSSENDAWLLSKSVRLRSSDLEKMLEALYRVVAKYARLSEISTYDEVDSAWSINIAAHPADVELECEIPEFRVD